MVVTLNRKSYERIERDKDSAYVSDLLAQIAGVPHPVLVHEAVYGGGDTLDLSAADEWDGYTWNDTSAAEMFGVISDDTRLRVNALLASQGIDLSVYKRNAEASVLAVAFIDDQLEGLGVERPRAQALVAKYAKQTRRLQLDIRYERERKELAIREQLEAELLDEATSASSPQLRWNN